MKEDEHRAIFSQAVLCILADDLFSALDQRQSTASQLLVEVDVDDAAHIMFGGSAPYAGWTRGSPTQVNGPSGYMNALQFSGHEYLQLGDNGVEIEGNWTLDCWVQVERAQLAREGEGVLVESVDGSAHVSIHPRGLLGGEAIARVWESSGIDISARANEWVQISVAAERTIGQDSVYLYFIDGELQSSVQLSTPSCGSTLCSVSFFAVGGRADGTAPFQLPIHRLRVYSEAVAPSNLDTSGAVDGGLARYQPENSRSMLLSRGIDALDVQWDTIGWNVEAHDHVHVTLDSLGGINLRCNNLSKLWDRAVGSAVGMTGVVASNWTSSALTSGASTALHITYVDSDPCSNLWSGITCSLSSWPVGIEDCREQLDCDSLSWPADLHGSSAVCGSSSLVGEFGSTDLCVRERSYDEAESMCTEVGGRLCTVSELQDEEGDPEVCGYNSIFKYSWAYSPPDACPNANQSLGVPGGIGSWFSFVPTVKNAYYEIQLRSQHALDGDTFLIRGVFDTRAETIAGQPATLHSREDGMMLRWNATQIGSEVFVHVSSTVADAAYTMVATLVPEYSWQRVAVQARQAPGAVSVLDLSRGAVVVQLPFVFPFFGLKYERVWVASSGMLMFEEPTIAATAPFAGTGGTHSSIMAAVGDFDLSRTGASVTASRLSPRELIVTWHAPLFGSAVFSDVSAVLDSNGSVAIEWTRLDLGGGGSLAEGLVSHVSAVTFDSGVSTATGIGAARLVATTDAVNVSVVVVYGAEPGEGLDLSGQFVYALNFGGLGTLPVGDAVFTRVTRNIPGFSMHTSGDGLTRGNYFGASTCGDDTLAAGYLEDGGLPAVDVSVVFSSNTADARNLALVLNSFLAIGPWADCSDDSSITITLQVNPGTTYRLQAIIAGMALSLSLGHSWFLDMRVNGEQVVDDCDWLSMKNRYPGQPGVAVRVDLTASSDVLTIEFDRVFEYTAEILWSDGFWLNAGCPAIMMRPTPAAAAETEPLSSSASAPP